MGLLHPPRSADLSPTHHNFLKHLDSCLRGKIFQNWDDAETTSTIADSKSSDLMQRRISEPVFRCQRYVDCNGPYSFDDLHFEASYSVFNWISERCIIFAPTQELETLEKVDNKAPISLPGVTSAKGWCSKQSRIAAVNISMKYCLNKVTD